MVKLRLLRVNVKVNLHSLYNAYYLEYNGTVYTIKSVGLHFQILGPVAFLWERSKAESSMLDCICQGVAPCILRWGFLFFIFLFYFIFLFFCITLPCFTNSASSAGSRVYGLVLRV